MLRVGQEVWYLFASDSIEEGTIVDITINGYEPPDISIRFKDHASFCCIKERIFHTEEEAMLALEKEIDNKIAVLQKRRNSIRTRKSE